MLFDFNKEIFNGLPFRWYSIMWVIGFIIGSKILSVLLKKEGNTHYKEIPETFFIYAFFGIMLGARLGHVFFYQWDYYSNHLLEIFKIWEGGLASHGGAIGVLISIILFYRKYKQKYELKFFTLLDKLIIPTLLLASLIRLGNFFNSEIIGKPTESKLGIIFVEDFKDYLKYYNAKNIEFKNGNENVLVQFEIENNNAINFHYNFDCLKDIKIEKIDKKNDTLKYYITAKGVNRLPAQLFESIFYLFLFAFSLLLYKHLKKWSGLNFGLFLTIVFIFRFIVEFFKEVQVDSEISMSINIGQKLSIPFIIIGFLMVLLSYKGKLNKF